MEDYKELFKAMNKFQFEVENAKKETTNPFFGKKYADLSSIMEAIKKPLYDNGLSVIQAINNNNNEPILSTYLCHNSGQYIQSDMPIIYADKGNIQKFGSSLTYSRRYAISAILKIVSDPDDDGHQATKQPEKKIENKPGTNSAIDPAKDFSNQCKEAIATGDVFKLKELREQRLKQFGKEDQNWTDSFEKGIVEATANAEKKAEQGELISEKNN